jgi:hypothetical protein
MINIIYCCNAHVSAAPDFAAPGASVSAPLEPMASPSLISVFVVCPHFLLFQGSDVCLMGQSI